MTTVAVYYRPFTPSEVVTVDSLLVNGVTVGPGAREGDRWRFDVPIQPDGTYPTVVTATYTDGTSVDNDDTLTFPVPSPASDGDPLGLWVSTTDVLTDSPTLAASQALLVAQSTTDILYALSGRRFDGARISTVDAPFVPGPGSIPLPFGSRIPFSSRTSGRALPLNEIDAGVYPVNAVLAVSIASHSIDPTTVRIIDHRLLRLTPTSLGASLTELLGVNLWTDGSGNVFSLWPGGGDCGCGCGPARASITIEWGAEVPAGGREAARMLAREIAQATLGQECRLPGNVVNVNRQGVSVLLDPSTYLDKGRTGVPLVDLWLRAVNPSMLRQSSTVWSPDLPTAEHII